MADPHKDAMKTPSPVVPVEFMLPLLKYLGREIEEGLRYDRARRRGNEDVRPPALDPLLTTAYDIAAEATGQPTTRDLMKLRLAYLESGENALKMPRSTRKKPEQGDLPPDLADLAEAGFAVEIEKG